jgi:peroxiredoxin
MVAVPSTMLALGTPLPSFELPDTEGRAVKSDDFAGAPALMVAFICNHCPYVKHVEREFARLAAEYQKRGVAVMGISSNDARAYRDDRPEELRRQKERVGFTFPYLYDEAQQVARVFRAACTPDFYVFDRERRLVYRGQMDDSRPGKDAPVTGRDLRAALDAVLEGRDPPAEQKPSLGCNIKWKEGNEPAYFSFSPRR